MRSTHTSRELTPGVSECLSASLCMSVSVSVRLSLSLNWFLYWNARKERVDINYKINACMVSL